MHEGCISMATGTVKWFNNAKGFGFICSDEEEGDIFAHDSTIQMDGYRTLKAGQQVSYEIEKGPKGCHASSVVPIEAQAK
ncbi:cold shock domain-containing protein CspD [Vibrio parahaemolyticus]|nr:cold shock domain-containing protein CspD [Vibrio parahaemolyticus]